VAKPEYHLVHVGPARVVLAAANLVALRRVRGFTWDRFFLVVRCALLAYLVIAGMLAYVFVVNDIRGGMLLVSSLMLLMYAVGIPVILAFTVAYPVRRLGRGLS
jgi:hypothetical protein